MLGQSVVAAFSLFLLPCLLSQSTPQGDSRQCYEVRNETVCYFRPPNGSDMNWDEADKFCRDRNATLPVILDSDHQRRIEMYLTQHPVGNSLVFTAGRKSWSLDANYPWRWVNGKQFRTSNMAVLVANEIFGCIQFDVAMIRDGISSCSFYPGSFICQYPESVCVTLDRTAYHLHIRSHCFVIRNDHLRWYHARNKCIEGGGDLAAFDDVDSLTAFSNFTSVATSIFGPTRYFVGLQRKWWTWRAKESLDATYTNWPQRRDHDLYTPDDQDGLECLCSDVLNKYKWRSCNCLKGKSIICQSGTEVEIDAHQETLKERSISNSRIDKFSNASRCYDVGRTDQVCYFTPEIASRLNFAGASQWCRDHNATLPIIRNKVFQKSLESFLETTSLPVYHLWTSGIKVKTGIWSWVNGQPFGESDMEDIKRPFSYHVRTRSTETLERKGRLWRTRSSEKNPNSQHTGYICQFPGDSCGRFVNGFRTKDDACLVVSDEKVSWYTSRNKCIDSGGDLATFEDSSKLETLSSLLATEESYHVGLEKSRWIWYRADESADTVRYTNWNESLGEYATYELDVGWKCALAGGRVCARERENSYFCMCLDTFRYRWTPCDCDLTLRFVCQRDELNSGLKSFSRLTTSLPQNVELCRQGNRDLIIAGVEGLIIAALVISTVSLAIRLRKKSKANAEMEMHMRMDRSIPSLYQDLKIYDEVK